MEEFAGESALNGNGKKKRRMKDHPAFKNGKGNYLAGAAALLSWAVHSMLMEDLSILI